MNEIKSMGFTLRRRIEEAHLEEITGRRLITVINRCQTRARLMGGALTFD